MMHEHAQFEDGGVSVETGLMEMADRMRGGRWKVFNCQTHFNSIKLVEMAAWSLYLANSTIGEIRTAIIPIAR